MGIEAFTPFIDKFGLVTPNGQPSGNGLRFTAEALIFLETNNAYVDLKPLYEAVQKCEHDDLWDRSPENKDHESFDDYLALASAGYSPLHHGLKWVSGPFGIPMRWVYNNVNPGVWYKKSWLGRFPHVIAAFYWAEEKNPPLWMALYTFFHCILPVGKDQDAHVMRWHIFNCVKRRSWLMCIAHNIWKRGFYQAYPGGFKELITAYFGHPHPLADIWIDP